MTAGALLLPLIALVVVGLTVPVPYVAMGQGPTVDTLGVTDIEVEGDDGPEVVTVPVVEVTGVETDETGGHLNMTTVAVRDGLTLFDALGYWASGDTGIVPRDQVYAPGKSRDEVIAENEEDFLSSEQAAELAAMRYLGELDTIVTEVGEDSGAYGVLEDGDVLLAVDGAPVEGGSLGLLELLTGVEPGQTVQVTVRRDDREQDLEVIAGEPVGDRDGASLGVSIAEEITSPAEVSFNLAGIGGPSAGLMFTLALIDMLSPGELNAGLFVAGTGAIDEFGTVAPIGGIPYKMAAADEVGATVFLVPADNCTEAVRTAPDDLTLVRVDTVDDAIDSMAAIGAGRDAPTC